MQKFTVLRRASENNERRPQKFPNKSPSQNPNIPFVFPHVCSHCHCFLTPWMDNKPPSQEQKKLLYILM